MGSLISDLRHAFRALAKAPVFTAVTATTLALGIGANSAIFSLVNAALLRPLGFADSERLMLVYEGLGGSMKVGVSPPDFMDLRTLQRPFSSIGAYRTTQYELSAAGDPEQVTAVRMSAAVFPLLGVSPALGRTIAESEDQPGHAVAVLSHGLWQRRFGGDPSAVGQTITLDRQPYTVIGVMPAAFQFPKRGPQINGEPAQVWTPLALSPFERSQHARGMMYNHSVVGRLREDVTPERAVAEIERLGPQLVSNYPPFLQDAMKSLSVTAIPLADEISGEAQRPLLLLLGAVGLVLLVACANVANLFLVRSEARRREVAVRRALGAGRLGIARYFLAESLLLSMAGAVVGLALAWGGVRLLVTLGPTNLPRLGEVQLDGVVAAFTLALTVLTAAVFGSMPMLRVVPLARSLHDGGRSQTASRTTHRARQLMMGGQVALALVLLASSGLMVRSFQKLRAIDHGFDARSALTFRIGLPPRDYPNQPAIVAAQRAILDRLSALPGVTAASASTCLPLAEEGMCFASIMRVEGRVPVPGVIPPIVAYRAIAGGYLDTIGIRLLRGRRITRADDERGEPIAVVNQALASAYFPNQDAIGQRVTVGPPRNRLWLTIVGIVVNTPVRTLAEPNPTGQLFLPMSLARSQELPVSPDAASMGFIVRSATPPLGLVPSVRRAIDAIDKNLAIAQVHTLEDTLDRASAQMAFTMVLLAIAAGVALLLGVIGIYGVMSYVVSQRTGEIGVRLALGAEPSSVARMIVRQGGVVALAGITVGLAAAVAGSRLIGSLLYGVSPRDPGVFAAATLVLLGVALLACWLPARRAARLSPLEALKAE
jgi:putative ABC transport system permease protein